VRLPQGNFLIGCILVALTLQMVALMGWLPLSFPASEAAISLCAFLCAALALAYIKWGLSYIAVKRDRDTTDVL
jgi:uncharacterized membrane protein